MLISRVHALVGMTELENELLWNVNYVIMLLNRMVKVQKDKYPFGTSIPCLVINW